MLRKTFILVAATTALQCVDALGLDAELEKKRNKNKSTRGKRGGGSRKKGKKDKGSSDKGGNDRGRGLTPQDSQYFN